VVIEIEEEAGNDIKLSNSLILKEKLLLREFNNYPACYGNSGGSPENLRAPAQLHLDFTYYSHVGEVAA